MKAFRVLLKNELKMSLRGMDMLIFAIAMPLVVLVILGMVFGHVWSTLHDSNLCGRRDGAAVSDFRLPCKTDFETVSGDTD